MLAAAPLNRDLTPSSAMILRPQSIEPLYLTAWPEVIIILLLMVSMGQEARPAPIVTPQPMKKLAAKFWARLCGRTPLTESQMPKQSPLQMKIPTQEITKPLQRPAMPSVLNVCLQTSITPLNCLAPPFLALLLSLASLVRAQSREQTKKREIEPAIPPEAMLARNQIRQPSRFLSRPSFFLMESLKAKLRAWVGKYRSTFAKLPFHRDLVPSSFMTLVKQSPMPLQRSVRVPALIISSWFWILSLMSSMGAAIVLLMAALTPPIMKSIRKPSMPPFFPSPDILFTFYLQQPQSSVSSIYMSIQHFDRATAVLVDKLLTTRFHYSFEILIEHAGMAVAQAALRQLHSPLAKVLVLAGPGNNGADAMAAARFLKLQGHCPSVVYFKPPKSPTAEQLLNLVKAFKIPATEYQELKSISMAQSDLIIDGIFGFSFSGQLKQPYRQVIDKLKEFESKVLSIDIPSGWDVEEGNINGLFHPAHLISLTMPKKGVSGFKGNHWLGGKFVPQQLADQLGLSIPNYPPSQMILKLSTL